MLYWNEYKNVMFDCQKMVEVVEKQKPDKVTQLIQFNLRFGWF